MSRRGLTPIPVDLEYLPMEHLCHLLRIVVQERDSLADQLQREQARTAAATAATAYQNDFGFPAYQNDPITTTNNTTAIAQAAAAAATATPPSNTVPPTFKPEAVKKRIAKKSFTMVKKTPHNKAKKPFTEISEAVPNAASALALFEGFDPKSDTSRLMKWDLNGEQVVQWLEGANRYIHPVKFDGKVIMFGGNTKPTVYAWASYESLQAKYDKKGGSLSLKFRTKMVGSGRPAEGENAPPCFA